MPIHIESSLLSFVGIPLEIADAGLKIIPDKMQTRHIAVTKGDWYIEEKNYDDYTSALYFGMLEPKTEGFCTAWQPLFAFNKVNFVRVIYNAESVDVCNPEYVHAHLAEWLGHMPVFDKEGITYSFKGSRIDMYAQFEDGPDGNIRGIILLPGSHKDDCAI